MNYLSDEQFRNNILNEKVDNPSEEKIYRLSSLYFIRNIIFVIVLLVPSINVLFGLRYSNIDFSLIFTLLVEILIYTYIFYLLNTIFKYKIIVNKNEIINSKTVIRIKDIEKLSIKVSKISRRYNERVLSIITKDKKEYLFRLNISKNIRFIKQISILSNLEVEI